MTSFNNNELLATGMWTNNYDWAFESYTTLQPFCEGDFDADIAAITESSGYESGYFSSETESFEASNTDLSTLDDALPSAVSEYGPKHDLHTSPLDVIGSQKSTHGSIYTGALNKSTTQLEKSSLAKNQKQMRMSESLCPPAHEKEQETAQKDSAVESPESRPFLVRQWANTDQRHERIAYRLANPANFESSQRRKIRGGM